jgi:hypothetical protein
VRFGSNRLAPVLDFQDTAPPTEDRIVTIVPHELGFRHAGGIQALGNILAIPRERAPRTEVSRPQGKNLDANCFAISRDAAATTQRIHSGYRGLGRSMAFDLLFHPFGCAFPVCVFAEGPRRSSNGAFLLSLSQSS